MIIKAIIVVTLIITYVCGINFVIVIIEVIVVVVVVFIIRLVNECVVIASI